MLRCLLLAGCIFLYPIASSADALDAFSRFADALERLYEFVINQGNDQVRREAASRVSAEFIFLASSKKDLAKQLDDVVAGKANLEPDQIARNIQLSSRSIVVSIRNLDNLIRAIDPVWIGQHTDLIMAADDLKFEKIRFIDNSLLYYANGQRELQLDPVRMTALSESLRAEAARLDDQAKRLGDASSPH
jgi:hypothetical protein